MKSMRMVRCISFSALLLPALSHGHPGHVAPTGLIDTTLHAFLSDSPLAGLLIGALVAAGLAVTRAATRRSKLTAASARSRTSAADAAPASSPCARR